VQEAKRDIVQMTNKQGHHWLDIGNDRQSRIVEFYHSLNLSQRILSLYCQGVIHESEAIQMFVITIGYANHKASDLAQAAVILKV
jgi:hypothetical protein